VVPPTPLFRESPVNMRVGAIANARNATRFFISNNLRAKSRQQSTWLRCRGSGPYCLRLDYVLLTAVWPQGQMSQAVVDPTLRLQPLRFVIRFARRSLRGFTSVFEMCGREHLNLKGVGTCGIPPLAKDTKDRPLGCHLPDRYERETTATPCLEVGRE
jgi:hypothetical protein